jgi:hypothetical protein
VSSRPAASHEIAPDMMIHRIQAVSAALRP